MPSSPDGLIGDTPEADRGLHVLELAELAPSLRRVMRWVMRTGECNDAELRQSAHEMPEGDRLSPSELDEALRTLLAENWLVRVGEGESATYRINLARRRGHVLDSEPQPGRRRSSLTMKGIWDKLDETK